MLFIVTGRFALRLVTLLRPIMAAETSTAATAPAPQAETPASHEPIEAAAPGEVDDQSDFESSDYDAASVSGSTSVASSVYRFAYENGRRYHQYKNARYPIPNDDTEQNREDMKHALMLELTNGKYFFAPIGDNPQKIIDLGTGTGIWAIDVADRYPSAEVFGIDQTPIQPNWVPPNLRFIVDNIEEEWLHGSDFDFVHIRQVMPVLRDGEKVLRSAYENLKPGGWIEIQELGGQALCDDDTMPEDYSVNKFLDRCQEALGKFGADFRAGNKLQEPLEKAGFTNITCKKLKVPIGPWAKDKTLRLIGMYFRLILGDLLGAMGARPFRALGLSEAEIEVFLAGVRKDLKSASAHSYFNYLFWTAQKPTSS